MAKFNIICERRTSTKLSKPSMVTPHYLFIIILVNTLGTELNVEKEKKKLGKFSMLEICLKIRKMSAKKLIFGGLVTMATKVMTITIFFVACKKSSIHWLRVLTTLAFRVPYFSEFYFALTS